MTISDTAKATMLQFSTKNMVDLPYVRISRQLCEAYASHYGFEYVFEVEENASWHDCIIGKMDVISRILSAMSPGEYLVYVDTDAFIALPELDLRTLIDAQHEFFIAQDICKNAAIQPFYIATQALAQANKISNPPISLFSVLQMKFANYNEWKLSSNLFISMQNPWGLNTGFMILKNSADVVGFFQECIKYSQCDWRFHENEHRGDQDIISYFLQSDKYFGKLKILPPRTQGHLAFPIESEFGYQEGTTFLLHMYGQPTEARNNAAKMIADSSAWHVWDKRS